MMSTRTCMDTAEPVTVACARVSSPGQRDDLERQVAFLRARSP